MTRSTSTKGLVRTIPDTLGIDLDGPEPSDRHERKAYRLGRRLRRMTARLEALRAAQRQHGERLRCHRERQRHAARVAAVTALEEAGIGPDTLADLARARLAGDHDRIAAILDLLLSRPLPPE